MKSVKHGEQDEITRARGHVNEQRRVIVTRHVNEQSHVNEGIEAR